MNVPSSRSCAVSLLSRARPTTSPRARRDLGEREPLDASGCTGTTSPCGAATAMPTFAVGKLQQRVLGVLHVHVAVAHQRLRAHLREQVGDGDAHVGVQLARARDELVRARHVGARPSAGRPAPATPRSGGARSSCGCSSAGPTRPRPSATAARRGRRRGGLAALDVLGDDAPVGAGAAAATRARCRARARSGARAARP